MLIGDSHAGSLAFTLRDFVTGTAKFHISLSSGCQFINGRVFEENFKDIENIKCITGSKKIANYVKQNEFETIHVSNRSTSLIPLGPKISESKYRNMVFQS